MAKTIREAPRGGKKRNPHPIIIIVCEGEKTEPIYFNHFKKRDKPLHIIVEKSAAGKNYPALIKKAVEAKKEYIDNTDVTKWEVWCVSDVDMDYKTPDNKSARDNQLKEYAKNADDNGFRIALSNPCFEFWFLLHFIYTTGYIKDYDAVVTKLAEYLPDYKKNIDVYNILEDKQAIAINNAEKLKHHHEKQGKTDYMDTSMNPYTNVWELVNALSN